MQNRTNEINTVALDRRPIRSRGTALAQWLGRLLFRLGIGPNMISLCSILFALIGALCMVLTTSSDERSLRILCLSAAGCVQLRLLANLMDGIVADHHTPASLGGKLFNEWPDRVTDLLLLISFGSLTIDPSWSWLGLLAGCGAMMTAYCRELGRAVGAPLSFVGPMAKPHRMALLTTALIAIAIWPEAGSIAFWGPGQAWGLPASTAIVITVGCVLTSIRRLAFYHRFASANGQRGTHEHH